AALPANLGVIQLAVGQAAVAAAAGGYGLAEVRMVWHWPFCLMRLRLKFSPLEFDPPLIYNNLNSFLNQGTLRHFYHV
ncbi:MAG: hypothetical protein KC415_19535, partial [Anaerolineales bacterium]|nr:hypothetical protein [Anaerolineales bacterium]